MKFVFALALLISTAAKAAPVEHWYTMTQSEPSAEHFTPIDYAKLQAQDLAPFRARVRTMTRLQKTAAAAAITLRMGASCGWGAANTGLSAVLASLPIGNFVDTMVVELRHDPMSADPLFDRNARPRFANHLENSLDDQAISHHSMLFGGVVMGLQDLFDLATDGQPATVDDVSWARLKSAYASTAYSTRYSFGDNSPCRKAVIRMGILFEGK